MRIVGDLIEISVYHNTFKFVFYKSGIIFSCIIAHSMIGTFSMFGADNALVDQIYVGVTIVVVIVYCIYLGKIKEDEKKNEN